MNNSIISIMTTNMISVNLDDTVEHVEEILDLNNLSLVTVIDNKGKLFGVISLTDLVHFHAVHKNSKREYAWEICTHKTIAVSPERSIIEAGKLMVKHHLNHLVVMDNGEIMGIISSIDLIKAVFKVDMNHNLVAGGI